MSMHRLKILAGSVRRRKFTKATKEAIVSKTSSGGATVMDVARRHDLDRSLLCRWRRGFGAVEKVEATIGLVLINLAAEVRDRIWSLRNATFVASKGRGCARADDFTRDWPDAAEPVRMMTFEIVGIAWPKDPPLVVNSDLQASGQDDPTFLAVVHKRNLAGIRPWLIALLQNLKAAAEQVVADLPIRDRSLSYLR